MRLNPGGRQTKTILVTKPSSQTQILNEEIDLEESRDTHVPPYNEEDCKINMGDSNSASRMMRNINSNDEDWEERIHKFTWTPAQTKFFNKVSRTLNLDRLARLANADRAHEGVHRRVIIDKSVERLRKALASIQWEAKLTQWLHALLQEHLPQSYMAIYMDILQTLKAKVPSLTDRILFGRPGNINQDFVGYALKRPWEPQVAYKNRKLPCSPFIVVVPSAPSFAIKTSSRMQQWFNLLTTMSAVIPIQLPSTGSMKNQPIQTVTEQMVFVTRSKIQEIRQEAPDRPIILLGVNAGAALALQVGAVESVNCIVTLGLAYNTINGPRGAPNDHILDINVPVLFVTGQNAAKSSPEEIEAMREKMQVPTSLVVVGSADDGLRIGKTKRRIEGITQTMVDNLVMDEVSAFCTNYLENPFKIRPNPPISAPNHAQMHHQLQQSQQQQQQQQQRKRKSESEPSDKIPKKLGRPRLDKTGTTPVKKEVTTKKMITIKPPLPLIETIEVPDTEIKQEVTPIKREDLGIKILETKKLSPIPMVKTEAGITQLEIKPAQAAKQLLTSSVTFPGQTKPQMIKLVPSNQFIQLKPNPGTTTSQGTRIVTLKSTPSSMPSVRAQPTFVKATTIGPGAKIYTLKSGASGQQQLVPLDKTAPNQPGMVQKKDFSPTKFKIMKQGLPTTASAGSASDSSVTLSAESSPTTSEYSNILDMPVIFADHDGNIPQHHEDKLQQQHPQQMMHTRPTQYIIQTKPTVGISKESQIVQNINTMQQHGKSIVFGNVIKTTTAPIKPTNMVVLSKNSMRPIVTKTASGQQITQLKYAKFVVAPQNSTKIIPISSVCQTSSTNEPPKFINSGKRIEIINNSIIRNSQPFQSTSETKYTPIIINVDPNKNSGYKTYIKKSGEAGPLPTTGQIVHLAQRPPIQTAVTTTTTTLPPNLLIKPGILKHVSVTTAKPTPKPAILNRGNLTVKRVISLPPRTNPN